MNPKRIDILWNVLVLGALLKELIVVLDAGSNGIRNGGKQLVMSMKIFVPAVFPYGGNILISACHTIQHFKFNIFPVVYAYDVNA